MTIHHWLRLFHLGLVTGLNTTLVMRYTTCFLLLASACLPSQTCVRQFQRTRFRCRISGSRVQGFLVRVLGLFLALAFNAACLCDRSFRWLIGRKFAGCARGCAKRKQSSSCSSFLGQRSIDSAFVFMSRSLVFSFLIAQSTASLCQPLMRRPCVSLSCR